MSILRTSRDKWFLFFAHFINRYRLVDMSIIFSIFCRKFARFVFWMIFCFRSLTLIYLVQSCWFYVIDQIRRNLRVSLIASSHFLLQNDLTYRLRFAQNTISFIIFCKKFCIFSTYSSILRVEIDFNNVRTFFAIFLTFFKLINFQTRRRARERFDSISHNIRVKIRM
jgi:hypothetical protein